MSLSDDLHRLVQWIFAKPENPWHCRLRLIQITVLPALVWNFLIFISFTGDIRVALVVVVTTLILGLVGACGIISLARANDYLLLRQGGYYPPPKSPAK